MLEAGIGIFPDIYTRGIWLFTRSQRNLLMLKIWPGLSALFRTCEWHSILDWQLHCRKQGILSSNFLGQGMWHHPCTSEFMLWVTKKPGEGDMSSVCLLLQIKFCCSVFSPYLSPCGSCPAVTVWVLFLKCLLSPLQLEIGSLPNFIFLKYYLIINGKLFFKGKEHRIWLIRLMIVLALMVNMW